MSDASEGPDLSLEDLHRIDDNSIRWLMRELGVKPMTLAMAAAPVEIWQRCRIAMTPKVAAMMDDDIEELTQGLDDVERARATADLSVALNRINAEGKVLPMNAEGDVK